MYCVTIAKLKGKELISSERLEMLENSFINHPG